MRLSLLRVTMRPLANATTRAIACSAVCAAVAACGDVAGLAGKQGLPGGTADPSSFQTVDGALGLYNATVAVFQYTNGDTVTELGGVQAQAHAGVFMDYLLRSGLMTDELQAGNLDLGNSGVNFGSFPSQYNQLDARNLVEGDPINNRLTDDMYAELQAIRGGANMAIGMLTKYAPSLSSALAGHMYALMGYSEILLADMYCSGVPLSTLDFEGDFTYRAGSSTSDVYRDAIKQFDQAIAMSGDSARILNLARVGKGRALLALGLPDSAALAVAAVPDGFTYQFPANWAPLFSPTNNRRFSDNVTVSNGEGGDGFPYVSDGATDVRVAAGVWGVGFNYHVPLYIPSKYAAPSSGANPVINAVGTVAAVTVADWIEARLIRAEAALAAGDAPGWLGQLNELRSLAATGLDPLTDPVDPNARVQLMFKERAYWLLLSGHRQGDLRRLIRQYHLASRTVYPSGQYPLGTTVTQYSTTITAPVPASEHSNPLFTGCISRGA